VRTNGHLRWEIRDARRRLLAEARGPDGIPAGLAWLSDHQGLTSCY
jgi:hypothetical protein